MTYPYKCYSIIAGALVRNSIESIELACANAQKKLNANCITMNAPEPKLSLLAFSEAMVKHHNAHYEADGNNGFKCKKCGAGVMQTTCFVSNHTNVFPGLCAGSGKVMRVPLPYCPSCEGFPKTTHTCVHFDRLV